MKKYIATGFVYGKLWGGGFGSYVSQELKADNIKTILAEAKKALKDGSLDGGMGFEYLKGALLNIEEIESIQVKGKEYLRSEYIIEFLGDLTATEQDFLLNQEAQQLLKGV